MIPFLVVASLLMLGVVIVAWATRPTASYPMVQQRLARQKRDRVGPQPEPTPSRPRKGLRTSRTKPKLSVQPEAFSNAPAWAPLTVGSGLVAGAPGSIVSAPVRAVSGSAETETLP